MGLDILETADVIEILENYIEEKRPPIELRKQVDLSYKIENQSIIIFEIRSLWNNPKKSIESPIAKTTFVKSKTHWKIFWMRADLKWHNYKPKPFVRTLNKFIELVEQDEYGCFWG